MNTKERKIKLKLNEHKQQEGRERAILSIIRLIISRNNNANDILPLFFLFRETCSPLLSFSTFFLNIREYISYAIFEMFSLKSYHVLCNRVFEENQSSSSMRAMFLISFTATLINDKNY